MTSEVSLNLTSSIQLQVAASYTESVFYAIFLAVGNLVGLFGNVLVIAATIGQQANHFKLDQGTIILLRHLAISDVLFTLLYPVPIMVVYIARSWVFGAEVCYLIGLIISLPATANMNFILVMSLYRYVRCRFPLKVTQITPFMATIGCLIMWALSCIFPVYTLAVKLRIVFNVKLASCSFTFPKSTGNAILIFGTTVVPFLVIVSLNVLLWLHVRAFTRHLSAKLDSKSRREMTEMEKKQSKRFRASYRQGVITTTFITALFAVTWMPTVVRFAYAAFVGEDGLYDWVEKVRYFYFLGSWGNPIIYGMINKGFQDYFKSFVNRLCRVYVVDPSNNVGKVMSEIQVNIRKGSKPVNDASKVDDVRIVCKSVMKTADERGSVSPNKLDVYDNKTFDNSCIESKKVVFKG
ncbi:galanin receptor 2b-like [Bolinopsis microptera]|uniref:galanin receptor 2b-like n=1 Tax=Bolinopsis microptera TaxID=2820187 RepID=UPI00307A3791